MSQEGATAEELRGALGRTVGCGSARIGFRFQVSMVEALASEPRRAEPKNGPIRSRVTRPVGAFAWRVVKWGLSRLVDRVTKPLAEGAVGIIDFGERRCVYYPDPSKAEMIIGDRRWYGAPGTAVERLSARAASALQPLWLVDLVRGVVDAREEATERLGGRTVRRFSAHADLNRAAKEVGYEMAVPSDTGQLVDLTKIALEVWVDNEGYIRRVRHAGVKPDAGLPTTTLDLTELGVEVPSDWSRIPVPPAHSESPAS